MHIYINIYIYIFNNKVCEYLKNESSMHSYLIQNIPAEQNILFVKKKKKFRNSIHNKFRKKVTKIRLKSI